MIQDEFNDLVDSIINIRDYLFYMLRERLHRNDHKCENTILLKKTTKSFHSIMSITSFHYFDIIENEYILKQESYVKSEQKMLYTFLKELIQLKAEKKTIQSHLAEELSHKYLRIIMKMTDDFTKEIESN